MTDFDNERATVFWTNNPNILLAEPFLLFPSQKLSLEDQLNAVSRSIIILCFVGYLYSRKTSILFVTITLLFSIYVFYSFKQKQQIDSLFEQFISPGAEICANSANKTKVRFQFPSANNPLGNTTEQDIENSSEIEKLPAVPATKESSVAINEATLMSIQMMNPNHLGISNKLHSTLGDQFVFEESMRNFYSMPSTTIPNDSKGFADFCYGLQGSGRDKQDANGFKLARELPMS